VVTLVSTGVFNFTLVHNSVTLGGFGRAADGGAGAPGGFGAAGAPGIFKAGIFNPGIFQAFSNQEHLRRAS
jgi:hypothetical protein